MLLMIEVELRPDRERRRKKLTGMPMKDLSCWFTSPFAIVKVRVTPDEQRIERRDGVGWRCRRVQVRLEKLKKARNRGLKSWSLRAFSR